MKFDYFNLTLSQFQLLFMVQAATPLTNFFKLGSLFFVPGICGALIFADWYHTYQLKTGKKKSILEDLVGPNFRDKFEGRVNW
jgi:hypothetical protein